MKPKKISKTLEKIARDVLDSDEFVAHIAGITDRYRREHALDAGPRGREVRQSLKAFRKHALALMQWLEQAQKKTNSIEFDALSRMGAAMHSAPNQTLVASVSVYGWLLEADKAASIAEAQIVSKGSEATAPVVAAEALRATFERHGLKWSTQLTKTKAAAPITLMCAIAKSAGDDSITPVQARAFLVADIPRKK